MSKKPLKLLGFRFDTFISPCVTLSLARSLFVACVCIVSDQDEVWVCRRRSHRSTADFEKQNHIREENKLVAAETTVATVKVDQVPAEGLSALCFPLQR